MACALVIHVRLHDGRYHGMPDWPPSPARLFQALIAGTAGGGELTSEDQCALEWLEGLSPPIIAAPLAREGRGLKNYVPNNDIDSVNRDPARIGEVRAAKVIKPRLFDRETPLFYRWALRDSDGADNFAHRICGIADRLYQLGRGIDMAWAWGEILEETEAEYRLNEHSGTVHRPCDSGSGQTLACPEVGSLRSLLDRHSAQRRRFTSVFVGKKVKQIFAQPPKPRFRQIAYNSPTNTRLYDLIGTLAPWPPVRCAELSTRVRDAAVQRLVDALPGKKDEIERVLIGRNATEADKASRVRILALPSIGHEHADHKIRRLLVMIPPNCPLSADDVAWAFSGLALQIDTETGEVHLDLVPATSSRMLEHYGVGATHAARRWRTVTPAALPEAAARRRIDPQRVREEAKGSAERVTELNRGAAAVLQALRHAGVGGNISAVQLQREPFDAKGDRAEAFAAGTRFAKERLWHIEIAFAEPVSGPIVLGDGRYMGLGLMAPVRSWHNVEGLYCFSISGGLTPGANAADCSRALRRAVMARVQDVIGQRNKLPTFFTGHEADGNPARSGMHAHLAFVADLVRHRLLIVPPHVLERRLPTRAESANLKTLDAALKDLAVLRAGASGRLKLVPSLVDPDDDRLFAFARSWESTTRYQPTRHDRRVTPTEALVSNARSEIRRLGLPVPSSIEVVELCEGPRGGLAARMRLRFTTAIRGLILIGRTRHMGGGLFSGAE